MKFDKVQINGNDFIVLTDVVGLKNDELRKLAIRLCDPHYGIGGDILVLLYTTNFQYYLRFFNCSGVELPFNGHGLLSVAKLLSLQEGVQFCLNTLRGEKYLQVYENEIELDYGQIGQWQKFRIDYFKDPYYLIDLGTPHIVKQVEDVNQVNFEELISSLKHKNIDITVFALTKAPETLNARTYLNGVGELLSSGDGAAGAFYVFSRLNQGVRKLVVHFLGGDVQVELGGYQQIKLRVTPKFVFSGEIPR